MKKPSEQLQRSLCVPPSLDEYVENLAFVIDRTPKKHALSADPTDDFIEMPSGRRGWTTALQPPGNQRSELDGPAADRLVTHIDPTSHHQLFDVTKT
jgi:hypothetical protein